VSSVEILNYIRKILGKYEKVMGIRVYPSFSDHLVKRVTVDENGTKIDVVDAMILRIINDGGAPVMFNLDRPVTMDEYFYLPPYGVKLIGRFTSSIYAKVPQGYGSTKLVVEGLKNA